MKIEQWAVASTGVGKPDYSKEISLGRVRPGFMLGWNQVVKIYGIEFSPPAVWNFAWHNDPLALGEWASFYDYETGIPMPYNVPEGWTAQIVEVAGSFNQDVRVELFVQPTGIPMLAPIGPVALISGGSFMGAASVMALSTALLQSFMGFEIAYDIVFMVENIGGGDLEGGMVITSLWERTGSPELLPERKRVRCKRCGHEWEVAWETTFLTCPECGWLTVVGNLRGWKGTL